MTLHVLPKAFADALARVMGAVERSKEQPVLGHVLLTTSGGYLTLRTTDLNVEITTAIDCEGNIDPICAPADRLQATMARLVDRSDAELRMDDAVMVITSGRSRFTLPTLTANIFPSLKMKDVGSTFIIEGKVLASLFESCAFAIPTDNPRQRALEGLQIFRGTIHDGQGEKLCGVATDGYMMSLREVDADLPSDMPAVVVPKKAVQALAKMVLPYSEVAIEISENRFIAAFGPTRFTTKLVDTPYPEWRFVVPKVESNLSYDSDALAAAISNAYSAVAADKKHKGMALSFHEAETEFDIHNDISTAGGFDACPHSLLTEVPAGRLGVNPTKLLDLIAGLGGETIQLGLQDAASTVLITSPNLTDRKAVIMPMKV